MSYQVVQRVSDKVLLVVDSDVGQRQLWTAGVLRSSSNTARRVCCVCRLGLVVGETTWRPVGNAKNRYKRAHGECL